MPIRYEVNGVYIIFNELWDVHGSCFIALCCDLILTD